MPTIGTMLEKVYCDMDPDEGVDEEYKSTNDKVFTWKLLRSIAENDLSKFNNKERSYEIEQLAHSFGLLLIVLGFALHLYFQRRVALQGGLESVE